METHPGIVRHAQGIAVALTAALCVLTAHAEQIENVASSGDSKPLVLLHVSLDDCRRATHARGRADLLCLSPDLGPGHTGKAATILNRDQSLQMEARDNLDKSKGTITLWYKPLFPGGKDATYPLVWSGTDRKAGENSMWLWLWHGVIRFDVRDPNDRYCTAPVKNWEADEWVHVAAAWDSTKGLSLWVNGEKVAERHTQWPPKTTRSLLIGTDDNRQHFACGMIDELKIFDRPLSAKQIQADLAGALQLTYATAIPRVKTDAGTTETRRRPEPLRVLFHLDFENGFTANRSAGEAQPTNRNLPDLVQGIQGKAVHFSKGQVLRYLEPGNLSKERGAIAMWVQTPVDGAASKGYLTLFREDGPGGVGDNALWLWLWPEHGLRFDPRDPRDSYAIIPASWTWKKDEWHHVVANWDCTSGTSTYVDGQSASHGGRGDGGKTFIPTTWPVKHHPAFLIGAHDAAGGRPWTGAIDEVRLFNRPLTQAEVRVELSRAQRRVLTAHAIDPYVYADEQETCEVVFESFDTVACVIAPRYELKDGAGESVVSGEIGSIRLASGQKRRVRVPLRVPAPGNYQLAVAFDTEDGPKTKTMTVVAVTRNELASPREKRLVLVDEVDAAALEDIVESAPSRVVDSPLGTYLEAGTDRHDRFALKFKIREPHAPHVAVIAYPDDKPRTMEVMLQPLEVRHDYQAQTGVFTGDEYPVSGKMLQHRITFWPQCHELSFVFMTVENGHPAAVKDMKIYRMEGGFSRLPVRPFTGSVPARSIGLYFEDPVLALCFGKVGDPDSDMHFFPGFKFTVDRALDYMQSFGLDTLHYPVVWYHGPLYGSGLAPSVKITRPHPPGYPRYLMRRLHARGMKFNGWLHPHEMPGLHPYIILDEDRVLDGEETVINMRFDNHLYYRAWHGKDPVFNPIDPRVQNAVKGIVAEILDRYGDEPAFTGITLNTVRHSMFAFGSLESGYNDINLTRFQRDTGIKIKVDPKGRYRFARSWKWLMDNARQEWVDWRCRMIHDYYKELAGMITAKRRDLTLGVVAFAGREVTADYISSDRSALEGSREQGIDCALFESDPEIIFRYSMVPADLRWQRCHGRTRSEVNDYRTVNTAPEIIAPFRRLPSAGLNMHDRYFEDAIARKSPLKGLCKVGNECGWRVSVLNGNSHHALETYVCGMNSLDPLTITKGGFLIGTFGMEPYLARFARAYRALPAQKFDDVPGLSDPVRVRQKVVGGKNYFYVLNRLPYPVVIRIRLGGYSIVTDIANEKRAGRGVINLSLQPYDLRSFRTGARTVVAGGQARVPEHLITGMKESIADANAGIRRLTADGEDTKELMQYLTMAEDCFASGRYARLYFLLQESWLATITKLSGTTK